MNRSMLAVLIGALMATGTVQAAAQDNTWYVGGKAGWSNFYGVDYNAQVEELFDATRVNENSSSTTVNSAPPAGWLRASSRPPSSATIMREMARPRPRWCRPP